MLMLELHSPTSKRKCPGQDIRDDCGGQYQQLHDADDAWVDTAMPVTVDLLANFHDESPGPPSFLAGVLQAQSHFHAAEAGQPVFSANFVMRKEQSPSLTPCRQGSVTPQGYSASAEGKDPHPPHLQCWNQPEREVACIAGLADLAAGSRHEECDTPTSSSSHAECRSPQKNPRPSIALAQLHNR
jgi:hypothetical protein